MHISISGCQAFKMNIISNENQAIKRTPTLWQLYAKACTKVEKIDLDLVNVKCDIVATEQRCSHPNETRDDIEVIEHVPKLRAILRESEAKLEIKNYNPPSLFVWRWVTWGDERKQPYLDCQVYRCHGNRT